MAQFDQIINLKKDTFFSEKTGKILAITGLVTILLTIILFCIYRNWDFSSVLDESIIGQFGDFIGGFTGSLFSLAGVILFYVALKEQRRDIGINQENFKLQTSALEQQVLEFKDQKVELSETRKVYEEQTILIREQTNLYKKQNKELKEQSQIAKVQQFDSSYFSYLNIFNNYKISLNNFSTTGNFFGDILGELKNIEIKEKNIDKILDQVCNGYLVIFNCNRDKLSPYFKTLYRIMVLIDTSNIDDYKKEDYFKLLRSQLSDVELLVLNYNYHTNLGLKVRSIVIKYNFLKHLNIFDKLEFNFKLSDQNKYELEEFLKSNESIIFDGIKDFKNIENEEDIERSYSKKLLEVNVEIKLKIQENFSFSIVFYKSEIKDHIVLKQEFIIDLFKRHLYTILYMSKYIKQNESDLSISTIDDNIEKIEYLFKISNIENL
jgi:hypothetical protein